MRQHTLIERAAFYSEAFPKFPPLRADERWLDGMWVLGNMYKGSGYYGAYPPTYLKRILTLFPDARRILHLFSGSLPPGEYVRLDSVAKADVQGNAECLSTYFEPNSFDLILADPPYTAEDAAHYGVPLVNRNVVLKEAFLVLEEHGYVIWLDQVLPMFSKKWSHLCGLIGIVRSTNHRFRVVSIFTTSLGETG